MERTLAIIKPDAVRRNITGKIISRIEGSGLAIVAMKKVGLTVTQAQGFYEVHTGKPFFTKLIEFMTSGPVIVLILEGDNAIVRWRELMGATNPEKAAEGTIRRDLAVSMTENSVHGSDAAETATIETAYFFSVFERL